MFLRSDHVKAQMAQLKEENAKLVAELAAERRKNKKLEKQMNGCTFDFTLLPRELQRMVMLQMDYLSFNTIKMTSKALLSAGRSCEERGFCPELTDLHMDYWTFNTLKSSSEAMRALCESCEKRGFCPELNVAFSYHIDIDEDTQEIVENSSKFYWPHCQDGDWRVETDFSKLKDIGPCKMMLDTLEVLRIDGIDWPSNLVILVLSILEIRDGQAVGLFIEEHQVRELEVGEFSVFEDQIDLNSFIRLPAVRQLSSLKVDDDVYNRDSYTTTEDLLALRAVTVKLPCTAKNAIRAYLKAWHSEERDIVHAQFDEVRGLSDDIETMVEQVKNELIFDLDSVEEEIGTIDHPYSRTPIPMFMFKITRADDAKLVVKFEIIPIGTSNRVGFVAYLDK